MLVGGVCFGGGVCDIPIAGHVVCSMVWIVVASAFVVRQIFSYTVYLLPNVVGCV